MSQGSRHEAAAPERWKDLKRKHGLATSWGIDSALISPEECAEKVPLLDLGRIYGRFYVPSEGIAEAVRAAEAMERGAGFRSGVGSNQCGGRERQCL